jgi:hypothetical protein
LAPGDFHLFLPLEESVRKLLFGSYEEALLAGISTNGRAVPRDLCLSGTLEELCRTW